MLYRRLFLTLLAIIFSGMVCSAQAGERKIHVLIVDGFSNHDWRQTTSLLRSILDRTGLFEVAVSTAPETAGDPAWAAWHPKFSRAVGCPWVFPILPAVYLASQLILISFSSDLNSGSPVTSSAFRSLASAAVKASAKLIL
jgi:hypothetical protein